MPSVIGWRRHTSAWKCKRLYTLSENVPKTKWVERYMVGISHPSRILTQQEIDKQMEEVNRALQIGHLIAVEQNFTIITDDDKEVITQYVVYHIGFRHRPPGK
jgi:thioredoxin reductase